VSNLPYVAASERAALAPEILRHEPAGALFAGPDGLDAIRALIAQAGERERVGVLALEHGAAQAGSVTELMRAAGFDLVRSERDLAGIERVTVGERGGTGARGIQAGGAPARGAPARGAQADGDRISESGATADRR
jgi:release factor glutamine methyltransferase